MTKQYSKPIQKLVDRATRAQKAKRVVRHRESADREAARELVLYIDNTSGLSPWGPPCLGPNIARNVAQKMARGKYDRDKAPAAWLYLVREAVRGYSREIAPIRVAPATRELAATMLARDFEARHRAGDWKS